MIEPGRQRQTDLSDDLRPELQGDRGIAPVGPAQFGPGLLAADLVEAGIYRNAGDPVRKGRIPVVLVDLLKNFHKHNLSQIFRIHAPGQMPANNPHDEWKQLADQFVRRLRIIIFNALQPCFIK